MGWIAPDWVRGVPGQVQRKRWGGFSFDRAVLLDCFSCLMDLHQKYTASLISSARCSMVILMWTSKLVFSPRKCYELSCVCLCAVSICSVCVCVSSQASASSHVFSCLRAWCKRQYILHFVNVENSFCQTASVK